VGRRGPRPTKSEAIATAAMSLFAQCGVRGATTRAIARRAQTTEGNLYRYYPSKQELARRVIAGCVNEFGVAMADALAGVHGPLARLDAFVAAYVDYAHAHPLAHTLLVDVCDRDGMTLPEETLRPRHLLFEVLEDGMQTGEIGRTDPQLLGAFIAGGLARAVTVTREGETPMAPPVRTHELQATVRRLAMNGHAPRS